MNRSGLAQGTTARTRFVCYAYRDGRIVWWFPPRAADRDHYRLELDRRDTVSVRME